MLDYIFVRFSTIGLCFVLVAAGCRTAPLPPVDLEQPGWTVREGQAVWKPNHSAPEIAGDILLATRPDRQFIQFTKTPFPLIVAQATTNRWSLEIPAQGKSYSGPGNPPSRLTWLWLARTLTGGRPPKNWSWEILPEQHWRLENRARGEFVEGYLAPVR